MTDGRSRRLQKLQQLWAQVVSAVEAERRVRTADVSSIAATESRSSYIGPSKCLQQRLSHGERIPDDEERRYYCAELCNTGIFRRGSSILCRMQPIDFDGAACFAALHSPCVAHACTIDFCLFRFCCTTDPDGSIRPYPPLVANDKSEQRRRCMSQRCTAGGGKGLSYGCACLLTPSQFASHFAIH